jgi:hypothetical protein
MGFDAAFSAGSTSCDEANGFMLGSIFVFCPVNALHITGTIFFFPVVVLVITCYFGASTFSC